MHNGAVKEHMDLSNFSTDQPLYFEENKSELNCLKYEASVNPLSEIKCFTSKSYCVLLKDRSFKNTAKWVNRF